MLHAMQRLQQIIDFGAEIARVQDVDILLEKILSAARQLVHADAGTIYMKTDEELQFSHTQNDTLQHRLSFRQQLVYNTFSVPINRHSIAGYVASTGETVTIPDVYQLNTDVVPYVFDRSYDDKARYRTRSMLTLALKNSSQQILGVMQLINAGNDAGVILPFQEDDLPLIKIFADYAAEALERAQITRNEILGLIQVLTDLRDPEETAAHVNRVGAYSVEMYAAWASQQGLSRIIVETNVEILRMAAMLHDIGKLAIPQDIRRKPGKFTAAEYELMKQHTVKGAQMLNNVAQSAYEEAAAEIAMNHHEYWDGSGYPGHIDIETGRPLPGHEHREGKTHGKRGEEIPVFGRIVAIADVYDALSCRRVFRDAMREIDVLKILKGGAGTRFDPEMVTIFFQRLDAVHAIAERFPEEAAD